MTAESDIGAPHAKETAEEAGGKVGMTEESLQRRWPDIKKARVVFALAAAALVPHLIGWLCLALMSDGIRYDIFLIWMVMTALLAMCWFMGAGALFLVWLGRRYGVITHFNCLALCGTLAFAAPVIPVLADLLIEPFAYASTAYGMSLGAAAIGMALSPFGALGGWIFLWRLAIRPAAVPVKDLAEVF